MLFGYNLKSWIEKTFKDKKFKRFTEIQEKSMPILLKQKNFIGVSSTGTGKTLAFLIPTLNKIELNNQIQVVIIAPTRELARQINSQINEFKKNEPKLKSLLLIGGAEINKQIESIKKSTPQIIVATAIRLKEVIKLGKINFSSLSTIILDEADMLIDLGFAKDIDFIFDKIVNQQVQKMAWSATLHDLLTQKLSKYFTNSKIVKVGNSIYTNPNIVHNIIHYHDKEKVLSTFVKTINPYLCIIFTSQKKDIIEIVNQLKSHNIDPIVIHGNLSSRERKNAYKNMKLLNTQYVVASDLVSRGLDIDGASHIISWDLPENAEWYVHRAGRCGRGKYTGYSYLFFDGNNESRLFNLQQKGIDFHHITLTKNGFVEKKYRLQANNKKELNDTESKKQILQIISKPKQKVKPNYKKKQKEAIKKIKQKSKRRYLENKIKQKMIEGYKNENNKNK